MIESQKQSTWKLLLKRSLALIFIAIGHPGFWLMFFHYSTGTYGLKIYISFDVGAYHFVTFLFGRALSSVLPLFMLNIFLYAGWLWLQLICLSHFKHFDRAYFIEKKLASPVPFWLSAFCLTGVLLIGLFFDFLHAWHVLTFLASCTFFILHIRGAFKVKRETHV